MFLLLILFVLVPFFSYTQSCFDSEETISMNGLMALRSDSTLITGHICVFIDSSLIMRAKYKDGKKDGLCERWFTNGMYKSKETFFDGQIHGKATWWYKNGQIKHEINYQNNNQKC